MRSFVTRGPTNTNNVLSFSQVLKSFDCRFFFGETQRDLLTHRVEWYTYLYRSARGCVYLQ